MKKRHLFLVIGLMLMASFLTPLTAQWQVAYSGMQNPENLYFLDSLNGWFVTVPTMGTDKVLRTTDGGFTFQPQYVPSGTYNLACVYFEDTLNGWAGGGPYNNGPGAILKTTDGGNNWSLIVPPTPKSGWGAIAKAGNTVIIGGTYTPNPVLPDSNLVLVIKTTNGGASWQVQQYTSFMGTVADMHVFDAQNYVIGGMHGNLRRTTNGGVTWVSTNLNPDYVVTGIDFVNQNLGYAIATDFGHIPRWMSHRN